MEYGVHIHDIYIYVIVLSKIILYLPKDGCNFRKIFGSAWHEVYKYLCLSSAC